jgi:hypothetical protein
VVSPWLKALVPAAILATCAGLVACPSLDGFVGGAGTVDASGAEATTDAGVADATDAADGAAASLVRSPAANLEGFAVDDSYVYWSLSSAPNRAAIARCSVDGCAQPELIADAGTYKSRGPVLAVSGGIVYYAVPTLFDAAADGGVGTPGSIWRVMSDGGAPTKLLTGDVFATQLVVDQGTIFWSNYGVTCGVMSCPVSGCTTPKLLSSRPSCEDTAENEITGVAVDATDVFFTLHGGPAVDGGAGVDGAVLRCPRTGCPGAPFTVALTQGAIPFTVAVDATHVYWATATSKTSAKPGEVLSADKSGSSVTTLASMQETPYLLTVDDSRVFWTDQSRGVVLGVPKGGPGGAPTTLASVQANPSWIANDAKRVFWLTERDVMVKLK